MRAIAKKPKGKVLDLSFVNEKVQFNLEEMEETVRDLVNI